MNPNRRMNPNPADTAEDRVWIDRALYAEVEERQQAIKARSNLTIGSLAGEVARARQHLKNSMDVAAHLEAMTAVPSTSGGTTSAVPPAPIASTSSADVSDRVSLLERENEEMRLSIQTIQEQLSRIDDLEKSVDKLLAQVNLEDKSKAKDTAVASGSAQEDVDLFGSDSDDDEEASKIREERLKAYQDKKSAKPALVAKSSIIFDVKPWDDETNMTDLEAAVRSIQMEGLLWGASKLVPLAYGIHKLQINCIIEDEKVSVDLLQETIEGFEDYVQSVDIFAFNKI